MATGNAPSFGRYTCTPESETWMTVKSSVLYTIASPLCPTARVVARMRVCRLLDAVMYAPASYGPRTNCAVSHLEITSFNAPIFSPFYNVIWLRVDCRNRSNRSGSAAFLHPALAVPDCSALCFESLATSNTEIISVACRNICIIRCEQPIIHHLLDFLSSLPSSAPGRTVPGGPSMVWRVSAQS